LQIDSIITETFRHIREGAIRRLVVDAVGDLIIAASDPQRIHSYLYALAQHLAVKGVTGMFTYEVTEPLEARLSTMADSIIQLGIELNDESARRTIRVIKARGTEHDIDRHDFQILPEAIRVK
jgi:circadian clock protein KaiC